MLITIYPADGSTPLVLGDDSLRNFISGYLPDQRRQTEALEYTRGTYGDVADRGNRFNRFTVRVDRQHDSLQDAFIFLLTHPNSVTNQGRVVFNQSETLCALPNAVISNVKCVEHHGVSTVFEYTIEGGEIVVGPGI